MEFIHLHYFERLYLEEAAAQACLSKYHFSRLFHQMVGVPYQDYLTTIRIQKAKEMLRQTPHSSVSRIALRVGFGSLRNCEGHFKRIAEQAPSRYRYRVAR